MSCFAISSLVSNVTKDKNLLDTVNVAFCPALYISGLSQMHWITCLSTRRFFEVFKLAASQTRLMHSLEFFIYFINQLPVKCFNFIFTLLLVIVAQNLMPSLRFEFRDILCTEIEIYLYIYERHIFPKGLVCYLP